MLVCLQMKAGISRPSSVLWPFKTEAELPVYPIHFMLNVRNLLVRTGSFRVLLKYAYQLELHIA